MRSIIPKEATALAGQVLKNEGERERLRREASKEAFRRGNAQMRKICAERELNEKQGKVGG